LEDKYGEVALRKLDGDFPLPKFGKEEDVFMLSTVFLHACSRLMVAPCIDLFATAAHHQLPKYITPDASDKEAIGVNAFTYYWDPTLCLYANPPWTLIPYVIAKICKDKARVLLVTPLWTNAPWKETLRDITQRKLIWRKPLYLKENGTLWPAPQWPTIFSYVIGDNLPGLNQDAG